MIIIDKMDALAFFGLALMALGAYYICWPAALIVLGAALLAVAFMAAEDKSDEDKETEGADSDSEAIN